MFEKIFFFDCMKPNVHNTIKLLLKEMLLALEEFLEADVFSYNGQIVDGLENSIMELMEDLARQVKKRDRLCVVLTTPGGSAIAVERYVNIIRRHYRNVDFIIPSYAYSAGTIFCMSGDNIFMDYFSVLGPIDPQVQNKEGKWVAALGYLDKVNEAIEKSSRGALTDAEYLMIKDLDLAELRSYEQAKDLTIDLLKKWLVKYKFKNWDVHSTSQKWMGQAVTLEQKELRAEEIAKELSNNSKWKSHGRPINMEALLELRLKIEDFSVDVKLRNLIRDYYDLLTDYIQSNNFHIFVQTRNHCNRYEN